MLFFSRRRLALLGVSGVAGLLLAGPAPAQDATSVTITIKNHRFQPAEVRVPAGKPISIEVINQDPTPEEFESHSLKVEKIIAGNAKATVRLFPLKPGRYTFFGEYNEATAQGVLVAQ